MRKFSANYIFTSIGSPLKNGIVVCDDNGLITDVIDTHGKLEETENLEYYNGIIIPGFINTHCHLELSYLKNCIPEKTGVHGFVSEIRKKRKQYVNIQEAIKSADKELFNNGIVAIGDISNSDISFEIKKESSIYYRTFVEVFGYNHNESDRIFNNALQIIKEANNFFLSSSLVPHAPYSLSENLFSKVIKYANNKKNIISIHNQESIEENELFIKKSGKLFDQLVLISNEYLNWKATGKTSLQSYISSFSNENNILLVHNTYTKKDDIDYVSNLNKNIYWVFCPNSNKFIEGQLPNLSLFKESNNNITIGTDSLASNKTLSVLDELKTLSLEFSEIELVNLLKWSTINGARALNIDNKFGSIEKGKEPGILLLNNVNLNTMKISQQTSIRRLL